MAITGYAGYTTESLNTDALHLTLGLTKPRFDVIGCRDKAEVPQAILCRSIVANRKFRYKE